MIRIFVTYVVPLLLPTVLYLTWAILSAGKDGKPKLPAWQNGPWFWLAVAGAVLLAIVMGFTAWETGVQPGTRYIAPHLEDGRVIPGRVE